MSVLKGSQGPLQETGNSARECKPDYEKLIADMRIKKTKAESLKEAIFFYNDGYRPSDLLATMVGELEFEIRGYGISTNRLIEQQGKEK